MTPSTETAPNGDAASILIDAADAISDRASLRDQPTGERSMARTVAAFNAMYGTRLTEQQGWQFMVLLKMARGSAGGHHPDDATDQAAYSALAGESVARAVPLGALPHSFNHHDHAKPYAPA